MNVPVSDDEKPFHETKSLSEMSPKEWESLCDGCGKCCVLKLEDIDTGTIYNTDVGCKLLDCGTARCQHYETRKTHVPDCVVLTPDTLDHLCRMPKAVPIAACMRGAAWQIGTRSFRERQIVLLPPVIL